MKVRIKSNPNQESKYRVKLKSGGSLSSDKAKEILRDGTVQGHALTDKQKRYFGWIAGGKKAANGASITHLSESPESNGIFQFNGPSHEDDGIPISYGGQKVEVEGKETGFIDKMGDLNVFGNMYVPGTNKKFKTISKDIAKAEQKTNKQNDKAQKLMSEADPTDRYEKFTFNSGMAMGVGAAAKHKQLTDAKEFLANLQEAMLYAGYGGDNSKKAQDGKKVIKSKGSNPQPVGVMNPLGVSNSLYDPRYFNQFTGEGQILSANPVASLVPINEEGEPTSEELSSTEKALTKASGRNSSIAVRHNNPGNMKYAPWMKDFGATKGQAGTDGGNFAVFPTLEAGQSAMVRLLNSPSYKGRTVTEAIKRWTGGSPYSNIPSSIRNKKISELDDSQKKVLYDTITQGEDSKKYNWENITPIPPTIPKTPEINTEINPDLFKPDIIPYNPNADGDNPPTQTLQGNPSRQGPPLRDIAPPSERRRTPFRNPLSFGQIAPELFTLATERPEFVPGQTYEPNLYQPYQVNFQDRLNQNNSTFRAAAQQLPGNAAALSVLAGQKYAADNQVLADEFRTNQAISNEITNRNTELLNDARLRNIQLTDQQFVRQEQGRANTRENIRNAMNSVASKLQQNRTETARYNAYANLFPQYTFDNRGNLEYIPNEDLTFGNGMTSGNQRNPSERTRTTYDREGNVKQVISTIPSSYQTAQEQARLYNEEMKQRWMIANQMNRGRS